MVAEIAPGKDSSDPRGFTPAPGGQVIFSADDHTHGREPWITGGTPGTTRMVADVWPGGSSDPQGFTLTADRVVFSAQDDSHSLRSGMSRPRRRLETFRVTTAIGPTA